MAKWYELGPFTVFDVETTGFSPRNDRMVELAALRIDRDGTETEFHTLIHPGRPIPACASRVHHITDAMVQDAPHFPRIGHSFLQFISGTTLVAHNARFDLGFLQESLNRGGLPLWKGNTMDTLLLSRRVYPEIASRKLQDLRVLLDLPDPSCGTGQAHRAGADVLWTKELLKHLLECILSRREEQP
ncbi:MAG: 3'-5' exonuclease [Lentisphaeria bacterium]|nr:3'-5' exonuclease [Lentisphaeria bacterium]